MEADGSDVEEGLIAGALVEGLDVAQGVGEAIAGDADLVGGQAIEHEGVIGVGTVGDGDIDESGRVRLLRLSECSREVMSPFNEQMNDVVLNAVTTVLAAQALEPGGKAGRRDDFERVAGQEGNHSQGECGLGRGVGEDGEPEGSAEREWHRLPAAALSSGCSRIRGRARARGTKSRAAANG